MPALSAHPSTTLTKALIVGAPGTGKTGALASLAEAGYNIRVLDFDNGLDILSHVCTKPERIEYETLTDEYSTKSGKPMLKSAKAFPAAMKLLDNWHGGVYTWTPDDVLVIDSLSLMARSAMNYVMFINGKLGQKPQIQHWGEAMELVENLLAVLYSTSVGCNVIVNSHIVYIGEDEDGPTTGYPMAIGSKLPPKIGRYFNSMLLARTLGTKRVLATQSVGNIQCKNPAPNDVPKQLDLATGLAEFFKIVQGKKSKAGS
jgi:hypothetical protein